MRELAIAGIGAMAFLYCETPLFQPPRTAAANEPVVQSPKTECVYASLSAYPDYQKSYACELKEEMFLYAYTFDTKIGSEETFTRNDPICKGIRIYNQTIDGKLIPSSIETYTDKKCNETVEEYSISSISEHGVIFGEWTFSINKNKGIDLEFKRIKDKVLESRLNEKLSNGGQ